MLTLQLKQVGLGAPDWPKFTNICWVLQDYSATPSHPVQDIYRVLQDVRRPLPPCTALCAGCCKRVLQARILVRRGVARIWDGREGLCQRTAVERLSEQASVELPHTASCIHATVKLKGKGRHNRRNQDCLRHG